VAIDKRCRARYSNGMDRHIVQAQTKVMRNAIANAVAAVVSEVGRHIKPCKLIYLPSPEALEALGDAAKRFSKYDGDTILMPLEHFRGAKFIPGLRAAKATAVDGFSFTYPHAVAINHNLPLLCAAGEVRTGGWCAYRRDGLGYAQELYIAAAVCTASVLAQE